MYGASTGVEPHFSLERIDTNVRHEMARHIMRITGKAVELDELAQYADLHEYKEYLACAQGIDPLDHLAMVSSLQRYTDEAISKTINMPSDSSTKDVAEIYREAYNAGASGITIYVDGSHSIHPVALSKR